MEPRTPCKADELSRYHLVRWGKDGLPAIMFRPCRVISFHPVDIEQHYCNLCGRWIEERGPDLDRFP